VSAIRRRRGVRVRRDLAEADPINQTAEAAL